MNLPKLPASVSAALLFACGCVTPSSPHPIPGHSCALAISPATSLNLVWIPPGTFLMGSPASDPLAKPDEKPQTRVTLTHGFWLASTPLTIGQWKSITGLGVRDQLRHVINDDTLHDFEGKSQTIRDYMRFAQDADLSRYLANEDDTLPMYFVSWNDAVGFCKQLTLRTRASGQLPAGYEFNLPTEAQWEYACRAGTTNATYAGPMILDGRTAPVLANIAWYAANSPDGYTGKGFNVSGRNGGPHPVAQKQPNPWGLFDMTGNLWQWCRDWQGDHPGGTIVDPIGPATGTKRINRGGSFGSGPRDERSPARAANPPAEASAYRGFRLALCPISIPP